jgi:hypothetical protein
VTWLAELDASRDRHFAAAAAQGLRSALLVPIRDGIATVGMLELLSRAHLTIDPDVTASLEAIALQLGHFAHLLRLGASPHWRLGRL